MNKLFKGAIAGAAGVALLLGGAGTFALWNDALPFGDDASITSGELRFGDVDPGVWKLNGQTVGDIGDVLIVPGDVLTYTVDDAEVIATGDYLHAKFGVDIDALTGDQDLKDALDTAVTVDGEAPDAVEVTGTDTYDIVVTLTFDPTTDGLTAQDETVDLNNIELTVTQVPAPEHTA